MVTRGAKGGEALSTIPHSRPQITPGDVQAVAEVVASGRLATGEQVSLFQEELARSVGAAGGVGAGTLIGVTALPALGPVGPLLGAAVGAYAGALVGALKNMDAPDDPGQPETEILPREPGILLAVAVETPAQRASAIGILGQFAEAVEEVDGTLRNGDWVDFDPLLPGKPIP